MALVAVALAALAACGGAAQRSFDGAVYREGPIAFRLPPVPPSWRRIETSDAALAFRDDAHEASVLVNARCRRPDDDTPLVALTNHLLMGSTEREFVSQGVEPFDGREALHTHLRAKWDGVPMELDIFVVKKDGCIYDFVYMAAPAGYAEGSGSFEAVVRGFRTLSGSGVV
jgi:hypothetical protein